MMEGRVCQMNVGNMALLPGGSEFSCLIYMGYGREGNMFFCTSVAFDFKI